jgi:hypothetical protein
MGMAAPIYFTADMVRAMPDDGNRYEVVYGELLVTPAPRPCASGAPPAAHGGAGQLRRGAAGRRCPRVPRRHLLGPGRPGAVDLFVAATDEVRSLTWSRVRTLLLVAEVLSPFRRPGGPLPQAASLSRGPGTALLGL